MEEVCDLQTGSTMEPAEILNGHLGSTGSAKSSCAGFQWFQRGMLAKFWFHGLTEVLLGFYFRFLSED